MSTVIEQKVVEMLFDNKNFEKNVSQSVDSLDKLNDALNKSTSATALENIGKAAGKLDFSDVNTSVDKLSNNFSILEQIAIGALRNIGASIEQHLVSALKKVSIDQVAAGFDRFGKKTESVQTIMSAISDVDYGDEDKLEHVENLLEKLAWFSDETSYNFTDMTDNISKFTAAGMDLDSSTNAMIGIANWAANAGQNAQVANRAMYQLSQAMGMGTIQLMDWKSIEVANMATKEVKELLLDYATLGDEATLVKREFGYITKEVAEALDSGKMSMSQLTDDMIITSKTFRNSLKEKWLTNDIFAKAMDEYASYSNALYEVINSDANDGLIDTASELIRMLDDAMKKSKQTGQSIADIMKADYGIDVMVDDGQGGVKNALEGVTELGIRAMKSAQQARTLRQAIDSVYDASSTKWSRVFESIFGNVYEATDVFTDLSEYLWELFVGPIDTLSDIMKTWNGLGGRIHLFGDKENDIDGVFQNLIKAIDGVKSAIGDGIFRVFNKKSVEEAANSVFNATKRFQEFTASLIPSEKTIEKISDVFSVLASTVRSLSKAFSNVKQSISSTFRAISEQFKEVFSGFASLEGDSYFWSITAVFQSVSTLIGELFSKIKLSSSVIDKVRTIFEGLKSAINIVERAFFKLNQSIFGLMIKGSIDKLAEFLGGKFLDIVLFIPSKIAKLVTALDNFIETSEGFHKFIDMIKTVFSSIKNFVSGFVSAFKSSEEVISFVDRIKTSFSNLIDSIEESEKISNFKDKLKDAFDSIKSFFENNVTYEKGVEIFEKLKNTLSKLSDTISSGPLKSIGEWFKNLFASKEVEEGEEKVSSYGDRVKKIFDWILDTAEKVKTKLQEVFNVFKNIWNELGIGDWLSEQFKGLGEFFKGVFNTLSDAVSDMADADTASERLKKGLNILKTALGGILELIGQILPGLAVGAGGFAAGLGVKSLVNLLAPIKTTFTSVSSFFTVVKGAVSDFAKSQKIEAVGQAISSIVKALGEFILMVAASAVLLAQVKNPEALDSILGSFGFFIGGILGGVYAIINELSSGTLQKSLNGVSLLKGISKLLTAMGISLILISFAVSNVAKAIDGKDAATVAVAIGSIVLLLGEMALITEMLVHTNTGKGNGKAMNGVALTLIAMAFAIKILAGVVEDLSVLDAGSAVKGVTAVSALSVVALMLGEVGSNNDNMAKAGVGLLLMSAAFKIMSSIVKDLGDVDTQILLKGTVALAAISLISLLLGEVGSNNNGILSASIALLLMSASIKIISEIVKDLGDVETSVLIKGVAAVAAVALIMAGLSLLGKYSSGLLKASVAMLAMGVGLKIMSGVVGELGGMSTDAIYQGIIALVVVLGLLVAAAYLVGPAAIPLLTFGAAVAVLGAGLALLGIGITVFITSLTLMVTVVTTSGALIASALISLCESIVEAQESIREAFAAIIVAILGAVLDAKVMLLQTILEFIEGFLDLLVEHAPSILEKVTEILLMLWEKLLTFSGQILEDIADFLTKVLGKLGELASGALVIVGDLLKQVIDLVFDNLEYIIDRIGFTHEDGIGHKILKEIETLLDKVIEGIKKYGPEFIEAAIEVLEAFVKGVVKATDIVLTGIDTLVTTIIGHIGTFVENFITAIVNLINSIADSIETHAPEFWAAISRLASAIISAIFYPMSGGADQEGTLANLGKNIMSGLANGISGAWESVKSTVTSAGEKVIGWFKSVFKMSSPSKVMMQMGEFIDEGLSIGIDNNVKDPVNSVDDMGNAVINALGSSLSDIDSAINSDITPTITPVMDLSQIQNGISSINGLFGTYDNYSLNAAMNARYSPFVDANGEPITEKYEKIANKIDILQDKFNELLSKFSNLQVVLDSGELVGGLVDPMDDALGWKSIYAGRAMG